MWARALPGRAIRVAGTSRLATNFATPPAAFDTPRLVAAAGTATVVIGEDDDATFIKARPRATAAVRTLSELLPMLGVARTECI